MSRLEDMGMRVFTGADSTNVMSSITDAMMAAQSDAVDSIEVAKRSASLSAPAVRARYKPSESEAWRSTYDGEFQRIIKARGASMNGSMVVAPPPEALPSRAWKATKITLASVSSAACFWHGLKRNDSFGWGVLWSMGGGLFPVVLPLYAVYQGYAKPEALPKEGWTVKKGLGLE